MNELLLIQLLLQTRIHVVFGFSWILPDAFLLLEVSIQDATSLLGAFPTSHG